MTKQQTIKSIKEMLEKMLPVFIESWSDEKQTKDFSFKTYRGSYDYGSIEVTGESNITFNYSHKQVTISQVLGKELSSKALHELVETIFKTTFSFESLSSEEYQSIKKIREIKKSIENQKKEIAKLETHVKEVKTLKK
jgi:hypothetical protein